ncbi:MAG: DUF3857 domain-containing protein [Flavipsychrobacter sp.]|nr:DUF3857 domain-containing protein [Flavipsychrobacter sp.]
MLKRLIFLFFITALPFRGFANDVNYGASSIDRNLLKNADAVIRDYRTEINIESPTEVYITEHIVITVLNEKGNVFANEHTFYSSLVAIESVEGRIIDKDGNLVKKIRSFDFKTRAAYAYTSTYSDDMERYYYVDYRQYPYTVEYTVVTRQRHTFTFAPWQPQLAENCAVEHASLQISVPEDFKLRFKQNMLPRDTMTMKDGMITRLWEVKNISAFIKEPLSYSKESLMSSVIVAPEYFECQGYAGNMKTWKELGDFLFTLNKNRDTLSDETKSKVKELTLNIVDTKQKINILYSWLQKSTRYVSIQYGIGGWQTIDAGSVYKNKYGDCKALSNYMMALLEVVGIKSYPVVIYGEEDYKRSFSKNFPHVQGNHEILCIPLTKDTMWLECTSPYSRMNFLGDFTDDRTALMITQEGGVLVNTPVYDTSVNWECRNAKIVCGDADELKIEMNNRYSGVPGEELNGRIKLSQPKELQDYENTKFGMPSYSVEKFTLKPVDDDPYMAVDEHVVITASSMYNKRGTRIFINMNVAPIKKEYTTMNTERKTSFFITNSYAIRDTFTLATPANTSVEYIPEPVSIEYKFGHYNCNITNLNGQLLLTREYVQHSGVYDRMFYHDYEKFAGVVNAGYPVNIVLNHN